MTRLALALFLTFLLVGDSLAQGIPGTVTIQQSAASKLHVTATQGGSWTLGHISSVTHVALTGPVAVYQSGGWVITATHQGGTPWTIAHLSSVMHVAAAGVFAVQQGAAGAELWPVRAHQGGEWILRHITSVVHVAAAGPLPVVQSPQGGVWSVTAHQGGISWTASQGPAGNAIWPVAAHQAGAWTASVNQSNAWTVQAAHQAGRWLIDHVTSVVHVAAAGPLPVVQSPQGGVWNATAHQGGQWNIAHVTSVVHVAAAGPLPITVSPQAGVIAVTSHVGTGSRFVNQSGVWTVQATHQAGVWRIDHVTSVLHVAAASPIPVTPSPQSGVWAVNAHQSGQWNVAHVTSVTHVAGTVTANPATSAGKTITYVSVAQGAAGTTELAAASATNKHKLLGAVLTLSAAGTMKFTDGVADLTGAMDVAATGGFVLPTSIIPYQQTGAVNRALNLVTTTGFAKGVVIILTEP